MQFGLIEECQVCASPDLIPVIFLGYLPPVNTMRPIGVRPDTESAFPAEMLYCTRCHLVQLGLAVDPNILFPPEYPYTSGSTRILRENFAQLHNEVEHIIGLSLDDLIIDIGSNDGTLLSNFQQHGHRVLGIEPTDTAKIAIGRGIRTINRFFDRDSASEAVAEHGYARLVTAANVFAHIHGVDEVMASVKLLVGDDGIFITESHYLGGLIRTLQYDTIYHEHLRYYSVHSIKYLLEKHGFHVFHVTRIPTHGGSIRVYASRSAQWQPDASVEQLLFEEREEGLTGTSWIEPFRKRVNESKLALYELLAGVKRARKNIDGVGAPSRASTLINYVGLDDITLDSVLEIGTSQKVGKYIPGTVIPVVDEKKKLAERQPEYLLLLSWHIADELCRNLKKNGFTGDFIVPLPQPHIVRGADVSA